MVKAGMDVSGDLGKPDDEKEFFKKGSIMKTRNKENCEFFHRIGMAMCLSPSSFHTGCECLENRVAKPDDVDANEKPRKLACFLCWNYWRLQKVTRSAPNSLSITCSAPLKTSKQDRLLLRNVFAEHSRKPLKLLLHTRIHQKH
jgi:hypothetical protein